MKKLCDDIEYFKFYKISTISVSLNIIIGINGWLINLKNPEIEAKTKPETINTKIENAFKNILPKKATSNNDEINKKDETIATKINYESNKYWNYAFGIDGSNVKNRCMCYSLLFNPDDLINVGNGLASFMAKQAAQEIYGVVKSETIKAISATGLAVFMSALVWPLTILKIGMFVYYMYYVCAIIIY